MNKFFNPLYFMNLMMEMDKLYIFYLDLDFWSMWVSNSIFLNKR